MPVDFTLKVKLDIVIHMAPDSHCLFYCSQHKQRIQVEVSDEIDRLSEPKELSQAEQVKLLQKRLAALEKRSVIVIKCLMWISGT